MSREARSIGEQLPGRTGELRVDERQLGADGLELEAQASRRLDRGRTVDGQPDDNAATLAFVATAWTRSQQATAPG